MALAQFMQVCLDANDVESVGGFWSQVLSQPWHADVAGSGGDVGGDGAPNGLRIESVGEPKTVKNRIHPDIYAASLAELERLGSRVVRPEGDDRRWTVMADIEGNEYCAFLRDPVPTPRLHGIGIDCVDPARLATWWRDVLGGTLTHDPRGFSTIEASDDRPFTLDFDAVPEPKIVKNRMHWDLRSDDVESLREHGAAVLRTPHGDAYWQVLADPEGNEFCVFPHSRSAVSAGS